jgi:hypothetical protein
VLVSGHGLSRKSRRQPANTLSSLWGREKIKFEHLRQTKDLAGTSRETKTGTPHSSAPPLSSISDAWFLVGLEMRLLIGAGPELEFVCRCFKITPSSDRLDLKALWLITTMVGVATAVGGYVWGRAVDCKPGQIDGQCGLSTFIGLLYGVGIGLALFLISTVCVLIIAYRRRSVSRQKPR